MITTRCPECKEYLKADYRQRAHICRCPFCGAKFVAEALGWWEAVSRSARLPHATVRRTAERPERRIRRRQGVKSPFEPVQLPEALELPSPRTGRLILLGCVLGVTLCVAGFVWWLASLQTPSGPVPVKLRRTAPDVLPAVAKPGPEGAQPKPGPEAPSPATPPGPAVPKPGPDIVTRTSMPLPPYAYELSTVIRMAGYEPTRGFRMPEGQGYACALTGHPSLHFMAYVSHHRAICEGFFLWPTESASSGVGAIRDEWDALAKVLGGFLPSDLRDRFMRWVKSALQMGFRVKENDGRFAREARFGDNVIRCENAPSHFLGNGMSVELARDYKPSTEIDDLPPVRNWAGMRKGVTLSEIEAFAGKGELQERFGAEERAVETHAWPDGHRVTLRNGRAATWVLPDKVSP